jgi:hypothetical protein
MTSIRKSVDDYNDWEIWLDKWGTDPKAADEEYEDHAPTLAQAALRLLELVTERQVEELTMMVQELNANQRRAQELDAQIQAAKARTEPFGVLTQPQPPQQAHIRRTAILRFRRACQRRGLLPARQAVILAALSTYFGWQFNDLHEVNASHWNAAAQAVKDQKMGW